MDTSALVFDSPIDLLEADCQGEGAREILLVIDWEDRRITAETRDPTTEGTPEYRWHGRESAYLLPPMVDASRLKEWVDENVVPLADEIVQHYEKVWDGNNFKGRFPGHEDEKEGFDEWMDRADPPTHDGGLWDIEDWLEGGQNLNAGELDAFTSDEQINRLAADIVDNAARENVVIRGEEERTREYLRELRQAMRDFAPAHQIAIEGYEMIEKRAVAYGTGARVLVPVSWVGCRVAVIRLEEKR